MHALVFFMSGFISVITQTVLARELLVLFQGNELSLGLVLSQWLIGVAAGSLLASRYVRNRACAGNKPIAAAFAATAFSIALSFFLLYRVRGLFSFFPGEGFSLGATVAGACLVLLLPSVCIGAQFVLGVRWLECRKTFFPTATLYIMESLGFVAGGIIFTYGLLGRGGSLPAAAIALFVSLVTALMLMARQKAFVAAVAAVFAGVLVVVSPWLGRALTALVPRDYFAGYTLTEIIHSPYGHIAVAGAENEVCFFYNGVPSLTLPSQGEAAGEVFAGIPLLYSAQQKNVLLIGGSGKYIASLLRWPGVHIDYVELDPWYIRAVAQYGPAASGGALFGDARVAVQQSDGAGFLKRNRKKYDAILLGVPYPATITVNRYFTKEFMSEAFRSLEDGGVFAFLLPGSESYLTESLGRLLASLFMTVQSVFPAQKIIPGEALCVIALKNPPVPSVKEVKERFLRSGLAADFLSQAYLEYALDPDKEAALRNRVETYASGARINYAFKPHALMRALAYGQSVFSPALGVWYGYMARFLWVLWAAAALWFFSGSAGVSGTAFTSGFAGMGLQMMCLWGLQITSGEIYHWLGLLSALFMAGLALGSYLAKIQRTPCRELVLKAEIFFCVWIGIWLAFFLSGTVYTQLFFIFSCAIGILLGFELPLLVAVAARMSGGDEARNAGAVYARDLAGGWLAALLIGTLLAPAWGFEKTLFFLLMVKAISVKWWVKSIYFQ